MSLLLRFVFGATLGFCVSPLCQSRGSVFMKHVPGSNISYDGLTNHIFDADPLPTKEELEYIKTWGMRWVEDWDRPNARGLAGDRSSMYKKQILLIRHGQYENEESSDDSIRCLTTVGEQQARLTGEYLKTAFDCRRVHLVTVKERRAAKERLRKALASGASQKEISALEEEATRAVIKEKLTGGDWVVAAEPRIVHVSDMTRAKQTAKLILDAFPMSIQTRLSVDSQLRERFPCLPEPYHRAREVRASDMKAAEDVFERYFHRPVADESSVEIIVGHANMIRYLSLRALQLPPEAWLRLSLPHCSITSIIINGKGHVKLSSLGSFGHLSPELVTVSNLS